MTKRQRPKRSIWHFPEGFCVRDMGFRVANRPDISPWEVVWATGHQYTRDGSNPDRVEVVWLSPHHQDLFMDYAYPDELYAATPEEIKKWVGQIRRMIDARKLRAKNRATSCCDSLESTAKQYEQRMEEALEKPA